MGRAPRAAKALTTAAPQDEVPPVGGAMSAARGDSLVIKVAGEVLALPASDIVEIIRPRTLTRVPHAPPSLLGVTNLRGTVLPIISLAGLLGQGTAASSATARIVVMAAGAMVGLLVDEVSALTQASDHPEVDLRSLLATDFARLPRRQTSERLSITPGRGPGMPAPDTIALIGFAVAEQQYALPLDMVAEVMPLPGDITSLPDSDDAMMGAVAYRGTLLPLVSLRVLLGLTALGFAPRKARVVVTRAGAALIGLVADHMTSIIRVTADALDPVPEVLARGRGEARIEAICRLDGGRNLMAVLAPAKLFDEATAAKVFADAQHGTTTMTAKTDHGASEQFVVFQLADEHYGLPIAAVDEVVRCPDSLTPVPRAPAFIEGVMNLRGTIVPIIDQRQRFAAAGDAPRGRRIIVVTVAGVRAGFVVDAVSEVLTVASTELAEAPDVTENSPGLFDRIATVERDGRMILLIDPKVMLDQAERDVLAAFADPAANNVAATA